MSETAGYNDREFPCHAARPIQGAPSGQLPSLESGFRARLQLSKAVRAMQFLRGPEQDTGGPSPQARHFQARLCNSAAGGYR
jgi:hypothetical protein